MDKMSLMLSVIMLVALAILFMPGILALNRGKILRNIALWLAIFTGLALIYKNFGPESEHPLFSLPPAMEHHKPGESPKNPVDSVKPDEDKTNGSQGFTPPSE